jgi:hypothetical protein
MGGDKRLRINISTQLIQDTADCRYLARVCLYVVFTFLTGVGAPSVGVAASKLPILVLSHTTEP